MRNLDRKYRITRQYRTHDQNCSFRKFKMADGRHFENSFISIAKWIKFGTLRCKFLYRARKFHKNWIFFQFKMADGRHIENRFLAISQRHIGRLLQISELRWRITCRYRPRGQKGNFRKFKMADGRHFENSFISISQSRIIRFRSKLVCRCKFPFRGWLFDKNRNFSNSRWRTDAKSKIVFGYISAIYWPINVKFGMEMTNHMQI